MGFLEATPSQNSKEKNLQIEPARPAFCPSSHFKNPTRPEPAFSWLVYIPRCDPERKELAFAFRVDVFICLCPQLATLGVSAHAHQRARPSFFFASLFFSFLALLFPWPWLRRKVAYAYLLILDENFTPAEKKARSV